MIASFYRCCRQRVFLRSSEGFLSSRCDISELEPFSSALSATSCSYRRSSVSTPNTSTGQSSTNAPPNTSLHPIQFMMTKRILRRRKLQLEATERLKNLNIFKKEVQKGKHDVELPVRRWADQIGLIGPSSEEESRGAILRGSLFNRPVNQVLLYQVVRWQRAKRRQPIASTKTKAEVRGGGRKPHAQKGSGRARQGSIRSPHMRGGGVVFGPKPRSFAFKLPKRIRRAGLMAALSTKTQQDSLLVVDSFTLTTEAAKECLRQRVLEIADSVKELDSYFVPKRLLRERVYHAIDGDETILQDEEGNPLSNEAIADNVLQRTIKNQEPLWPLIMNTGSFKESLLKLLPPAVRDERLTAAENILSTLNAHIPTGSSIDHSVTDDPKMLRMLHTPMITKNRNDTILVIHSDSGEDCGPLVKPTAQEDTSEHPVAINLESTMLRRLTANLKNVNCLPARGANVMDILRHKYLIITEAGIRDLTLRLTRPLDRGFKPAGYDWQQLKENQAQQVAREKQLRSKLDDWLHSRGAAQTEE